MNVERLGAARCSIVAAACVVAALSAACGQGSREEPAPYVPGLGEIMSAQQMRHLKLWYAGQAGNWPLAAYELDELQEGFGDVVRLHPRHGDAPRPLTELVPEMTSGPIAALREAIEKRSAPGFAAAYDALTQGCNACHVAARFPFNVVTRPETNPYSNQRFEPAR
jgi:hypothetical protein